MEQVDIHNRLSVWGSPFHIMIALTGAYFGLASIVVILIASAFYDGNRETVIEKVFGKEPELVQTLQPADITATIQSFNAVAPETSPIFLTIHEPNTSGQFIEVYAQHPNRLIYSENYRFDIEGNYIGKAGFSDGEIGRQLVYSTYRLHFGDFGSFSVKVLYFILGLSLTIVSVTGINIWLIKRKHRDFINNLWVGFVWACPSALSLSAIAQITLNISAAPIFWFSWILCCCYFYWRKDEPKARRELQLLSAFLLIGLVVAYSVNFHNYAFSKAALGLNSVLFIVALVFLLMAKKGYTLRARKTTVSEGLNQIMH